jgi:hypothetical protein
MLYIRIRTLQQKLGSTIAGSYTDRRELIINLQDLYRNQIRLMQESSQK